MSLNILDKLWHKTLKRPYYLARAVDQGSGQCVVLLHGIGRSGRVWDYMVKDLEQKGLRLVALDLLGFGDSPKPRWPSYNIDDHASAVTSSLVKLKADMQPVVLVGHSMGCLVAVRVARLHPELVKHLVLYEMPLYEGLPHKRIYRLRVDLYFRFYRRLAKLHPSFSKEKARLVERLTKKIVGQEVTEQTWLPFTRSLENTIMKQTTAEDIKELSIPMDVIYGRFDMLVIRGQPSQIFGANNEKISTYTIRASHVISPSASRFIANRVLSALGMPEFEADLDTVKEDD